jgi:hypothetical protein
MSYNKVSVLWFLLGNQNIASSRLHGYLIHEEFVRLGIKSYIIYSPKTEYTPDLPSFIKVPLHPDLQNTVSIIQKLRGPNTDKLISWLKDCGSRVIYVNCDMEVENKSWIKADLVLATSQILCDYHRSFSLQPVQLISEPYEYSSYPIYSDNLNQTQDSRVRVVWFGYRENWDALLPWKKIIESEFSDIVQLATCSNHHEATIQWSIDNQKNLLLSSDIAILPVKETLRYSVKSPNRLIQCMAMGLPCITGALQSYIEISKTEASVFIANNDDDFRFFFKKLLDKNNRIEAGVKSYKAVISKFSLNTVANQWIKIIGLGKNYCSNDIFTEIITYSLVKVLSFLMFANIQYKRFSNLFARFH